MKALLLVCSACFLGREFYETGKISFEGIFKEGRRNGKGNKND